MHEMGIAQSVIDMAAAEAAQRGARAVVAVSLTVGELSGVDTESLRFCFDCLKADTMLARATLHIEYRRRRHLCPSCNSEFEAVNHDPACPLCHRVDTQWIGGDELSLTTLSLEVA